MKRKEWNEALNHLDPDLIEEYVAQKDFLQQKKKQKDLWLRIGAIAACFCLIVGTVVVVLMLKCNEPPTSLSDPAIKIVALDADRVGEVFDSSKDNNGTNQYTEIYAPSLECLNITPLPNEEYLPIYSFSNRTPKKSELQKFIDKYLDAAINFYGVDNSTYEIEKSYGHYFAKTGEEDCYILFSEANNLMGFNHYYDDERIRLNGDMISILESDTDEQIQEKLHGTIAYICSSFGKEYTNIKIRRDYSYSQLKTITVYVYPTEEFCFFGKGSEAPMTSEYIHLTFHTDWGKGSMCYWNGSKEEAFLTNVSVVESIVPWSDYYNLTAKSKMLTLKEAEDLLKKGYVFGGHSCSLCMELQPEVDFSDYTCVEIEYVSDEKGEICIPFYAFYKYIGETNYGIGTYAKTYVPAIEVNGLDEYFQNQTKNHKNINFNFDEYE